VVAVTLGLAGIAGAGPGVAPVTGGGDVPEGVWRETAAVLIGGQVQCSGVLIAPTVALTAGHCNDPQLAEIVVGTNDLSQLTRGERIAVARRIEYPDSQNSFDLTALVLVAPSTIPPRAIATGWAGADIRDGAAVELVGYGAIDPQATEYIDAMQEAATTITDAGCVTDGLGCNDAARPAGELGAGGMGKDTCPGDSGGPLLLRVAYGDFLAGITSRGYLTSTLPCQDGGIYVRPDAVVDWIEQAAGVPVTRGPEPSAPVIVAGQGELGETEIAVNDPASDAHDYAIPEQPVFGRAAVDGHGRVRYCANPDHTGADAVAIAITDRTTPERRLVMTIPVDVVAGTPDPSCSVEFSGGCCSAGTPPAPGDALPFIVVGGIVVRRRRRR